MNKKEEILKVASREFAKYGYKGVSLENIAKKSKVTKAAIYYYFKSKLELFEKVLLPKIEELIDEIYSFNSENPIEELKHYIHSYAKIFKKYPCLSSILAHEFVDNGKHLNEKIIEKLSKILNKLLFILNKGINKGVFEITNPFSVQLMIVSPLIMHQTTKNLRKRISKYIDVEIDSDIENIADIISKKILKAILKE